MATIQTGTAKWPQPELRADDRLSRAEFERRYAAMPHVKKAELIEGIVYIPSPVSLEHGSPLDPAAMIRGDLAQVMAVLQQGLASSEHAEFVRRLQDASRQPPPAK